MADRLSIYLNDHLLGATAGLELFRRTARSFSDPSVRAVLADLTDQVAEDREALKDIMSALGVPQRHYKMLAGGIAERIGRLKLNGSLLRRSPLSDLVELEMLYIGVTGKVACWEALLQIAPGNSALDADRLQTLVGRGNDQTTRLQELREAAARRALGVVSS
jgi:hypothetical protein